MEFKFTYIFRVGFCFLFCLFVATAVKFELFADNIYGDTFKVNDVGGCCFEDSLCKNLRKGYLDNPRYVLREINSAKRLYEELELGKCSKGSDLSFYVSAGEKKGFFNVNGCVVFSPTNLIKNLKLPGGYTFDDCFLTIKSKGKVVGRCLDCALSAPTIDGDIVLANVSCSEDFIKKCKNGDKVVVSLFRGEGKKIADFNVKLKKVNSLNWRMCSWELYPQAMNFASYTNPDFKNRLNLYKKVLKSVNHPKEFPENYYSNVFVKLFDSAMRKIFRAREFFDHAYKEKSL